MNMKMMRPMINKISKTEAFRFGFIMVLGGLLFYCQADELTGREIIEQAVETHGGLERWENMKQLSFDKAVTLFLEDGSTQRETDQFQLFQFNVPFGKIEWEEDSIEHQIIYEKERITKIENDSLLTAPEDGYLAERAFFASEFVIKQPFDLLRAEVTLTREKDTIIEGKEAYVVSSAYKNQTPDADRWYYIVDKASSTVIANKVVLSDHTSWVENLTYDTSTDFKFNAHRKSYRLNEKGEKTYLRAEYFYTNYQVLYQESQ